MGKREKRFPTPEVLPFGEGYSIVEMEAPYGYVLNSDPVFFDVTPENAFSEDGNVVAEGYTDENGIARFTLEYGKYTYEEFDAPDGYQIDTTPHAFEIREDGEIVKAEMTNEKIPTVDVPQTGDSSMTGFWIGFGCAMRCGSLGILFRQACGRKAVASIRKMAAVCQGKNLSTKQAGLDRFVQGYLTIIYLWEDEEALREMAGYMPPGGLRDDLVIDPDMEIDDDGGIVTAYVETWFDVDRKFGAHTADDPEPRVNFYAKYNTESGELLTEYQIDHPDRSEWHAYHPTEKEKQLLIDLMEECCQKHQAVPCWNMSRMMT